MRIKDWFWIVARLGTILFIVGCTERSVETAQKLPEFPSVELIGQGDLRISTDFNVSLPLAGDTDENDLGGYRISLPDSSARARLMDACPHCIEDGVMLCGDGNNGLQRWSRFVKKMFSGSPRRSYFLHGSFLLDEYLKLLREIDDYSIAKKEIENRLSRIELVEIDENFSEFRNLGKPSRVHFVLPQKFHSCVQDPDRLIGCCVAGCGEKECCEKATEFTEIELEWRGSDGELIHFTRTSVMTNFKAERFQNSKRVGLSYCYSYKRGRILSD